jgi:hypothetical protein
MSDWVMPVIWVAGVVVSGSALVAADNRMKRSPRSCFGPIADWFVPAAGFAVFPVLGLACGVALYIAVMKDIEKGKR